MRRKSRNIKWFYSGQMKIFLECCKKTGKLLLIRASSKNDLDFWKAKVVSLENENLKLRYKLDVLEKEVQLLKKN